MESRQKRKQRILPFTRISKRFIEEKIEMAINIYKKNLAPLVATEMLVEAF